MTIKLFSNVTGVSNANATQSTVTLNLNGHTLTGNGSNAVLQVALGSTLTLTDVNGNTGKIQGGSIGIEVQSGTLVMNGGTLTDMNISYDDNDGQSGYNVSAPLAIMSVASKTTVYMTGGSITGNTKTGNFASNHIMAAGVLVQALSAYPVEFHMSDGSISNNKVVMQSGSGARGAGVVVFSSTNAESCKFYISGNAEISGNKTEGIAATSDKVTTYFGGGIYVDGGRVEMSGGTISGNTSVQGGGVYICLDSTFTMTGGSITNNEAKDETGTSIIKGQGGGVFIQSGEFTISGNASITGNNAEEGGGVYVDTDATFNNNGGTISGNTQTTGSDIAQK